MQEKSSDFLGGRPMGEIDYQKKTPLQKAGQRKMNQIDVVGRPASAA